MPRSGWIWGGMLAAGVFAGGAHADDKGDALLRQVRVQAHALAPLVGEYTATLHNPNGDTVERYQASLLQIGSGLRGGLMLPQSVFDLFAPVTRVPASTRYLGRRSVAGEFYDVVELKQPDFTFELYIGSDGLIHRARTRMGQPSIAPLFPAIDPQTGRPTQTPDELLRDRVVQASKTDANNVDIVVTSYHKARTFPARLDLPPPVHAFSFNSPVPGKHRSAFRIGLSPDGTRIAAMFTDNTVQILDAASGEVQATLDEPPGVMALVFSPDGKRLATSGNNQSVILWDAMTGRKLFEAADVNSVVQPVFTPDGRRLAYVNTTFGENPRPLTLWNAETGQALPSPHLEGAANLVFSPDGKRLATLSRTANDKNALRLWDTADWKLLHTEEAQVGWAIQPAYSPDGKWIALALQNGGIALFSGATGEKLRELTGQAGEIMALRFAADGKTLVAADRDTRGDSPTYRAGATVWDTATWQVIVSGNLPFNVYADPVSPLYIAPDGRTLVNADLSRGIRVWAVPGR